MTTPQPDLFAPAEEVKAPRPGSRADRMLIPIAKDALKAMAEDLGVCVRPLAMRRTDTATGRTEVMTSLAGHGSPSSANPALNATGATACSNCGRDGT